MASVVWEVLEDQVECPGCSMKMQEPYIQCTECVPMTVSVCLHCFARGVEFDGHQSNHSYAIIKNDFPLLEPHWTAQEELSLLEAVSDRGLGNWADVSQQVCTKNKQECERHYFKCYIEDAKPPLPGDIRASSNVACGREHQEAAITRYPAPVLFKLSDDPPRPPVGTSMYTEMAGYMAARGEFTVEHDNYVELDLGNMTFGDEDEEDIDKELKLTILDVYQNCLKERQRRKIIIRKYGLINLKKHFLFNKRYDRTVRNTVDRLRPFTRLMKPVDFDLFVETLHYEQELRNEIASLKELRENGICRMRHVKIYNQLKARREEERVQRHMLNDILNHLQDETACQTWLQRQAVLDNISKGLPVPLPSAPRRSAPPLDIVGLPGYDRLSIDERELCAQVRLVPEAFIEFRNLLITEYKKCGSLKLAHARSLIKIDVNKTRKIFDFLLHEGLIFKEPF